MPALPTSDSAELAGTKLSSAVEASSAAPDHFTCSIAAALEVIGDRWTLLILRDAFRGIRRFDQLHEHLGVARNLLADRLQRLVEHQVLDKVPYQERPVRYEYRLSEKGRDLSSALIALMHWGDAHLAGDFGPPVELIHATCGTPVQELVRCPSCAEEVTPGQIRSRPGPSQRPPVLPTSPDTRQ